jgi:hypothetical protein
MYRMSVVEVIDASITRDGMIPDEGIMAYPIG